MSKSWNVLLPRAIDPTGPESIADFATCTGMDEYESLDAALEDIDRYDAVMVRVAELDAAVLDRADRLKVISKHGSGLDNVDIEAASSRNIPVCNTPGVNSRSVAEHAIGLLFGVRRNLHTADRHVRNGGWERAAYAGHELRGDTLGLMGFGAIAQETASIAEGLGQDIVVFDPYYPAADVPDGIEMVDDLTDLFERSDAVSIHVPLTEDTHHAVSTAQLTALGASGVLINTARGGIVDEQALLDVLDSDSIGGAGLDNFETEPPGAEHPIYEYESVLLTPHVGGVTHQALERMSRQAAANVRTVYEGGLPKSTVNSHDLDQELLH